MAQIILPGLRDALTGGGCRRVELAGPDGEPSEVYTRRHDGAWTDEGGAEVPAPDLLERLQSALEADHDRITCVMPDGRLVFSVDGRGVQVSRTAGPADDDGGRAPEEGLGRLAEVLGIPKTKRKAKFKQARHFGRIVTRALGAPEGAAVRVLDLACGRSYLGLVLVHLLTQSGRAVTLHGVDCDAPLVRKCREMAGQMGWPHATFEVADLEQFRVPEGAYDVAVSLHACDTLTDDAIRAACEARVPVLFAAPCCQHELRHQWKQHPLRWVSRYGLLEQDLADTLTDAFRCLALEALGYRVKVLRFTDPDVTPKNVLIQARLTSSPRPGRAREAGAFLAQFGVRPRLARILETAGLLKHQ